MKTLLLLFIAVILNTLSLTAQNWSLVMPNDTLVYEKQDNNQFFTVWVDSTHVTGTDTTYFMNQLIVGETIPGDPELCDSTYWDWWTSPHLQEKTYKSQITGLKITTYSTKSVMSYENNSFTLFPKNNVGSTWVCDSISGDSMFIESSDTMYLETFNAIDSVKTLKFQGHQWLISKNHGLINGFQLTDSNHITQKLIGVQNLELGKIIPMAKDIYNFEVGDIFYRSSGGGDSDEARTTKLKIKILTKTETTDSLIYTTDSWWETTIYYGSGGTEIRPKHYAQTRLAYAKYDEGYILSAFPNTYRNIPNSTVKTNTLIFTNSQGIIEKRNYSGGLVQGICDYDSLLASYKVEYPFEAYGQGLGLINKSKPTGLYTYHNILIGYTKANGDTWGDVTFTSVSEIDYSNYIHIYPNPTNGFITIETEKINGISVLEMYDLQGRIIITKDFDTNLKLDISQWSNGVYFVIIKDTDGVILNREKIVVQ